MNSFAIFPKNFYESGVGIISGVSLNKSKYIFSEKIEFEKGIIVNGKDLLEIIHELQTRINKLETIIIKEQLCNVLSADTIKIVSIYLE